MKRRLSITFFILMSWVCMQAQDTLKLQDAIALALQNNFSITVARNSVRVSDINNSLGNAGMLPKVDVTGARSVSLNNSYAEYFDGRVRDVADAKTNNQSAGIQLAWTIFDGFNMFIQRDKLNEMEQLSNTQLRSVVENTAAQVSRIYFDLVVQQKLLDLYRESVQISMQRKQFAKARLNLGSGSELAYLQATVDLNADSASYMKQQAVVKNTVSDLNLILCRDLKTGVLPESTIPVDETMLYVELWNKIQLQSPELMAARSAVELAGIAAREVKSARYPRLNINTGYSYSKSQSDVGVFSSNRNLGFSAGLTMNYNIFNGFTTSQKLKAARIAEESAGQEAELQKLTLEANLQQVFNDFQTNLKLLRFEKDNMRFARLNWEIAQEKFRLGALNDIELRETQQKLLDAENRMLTALFGCKSAEIELKRISGQLSVQIASAK